MSDCNKFEIFFVREHKHFFNKNNKKQKSDYVLNIDKLVKNKFDKEFFFLNSKQAFLLNYEIFKLIKKAINISTRKYDKIIYINNNINITSILNIIKLLKTNYPDVNFNFTFLNDEENIKTYEIKKKTRGLLNVLPV